MKLFVYHQSSCIENGKDIHAICNPPTESCANSLCNVLFLASWDGYSINHLDTTKSFCQECTYILKDDYNIDIKQLAINQKLGVK